MNEVMLEVVELLASLGNPVNKVTPDQLENRVKRGQMGPEVEEFNSLIV